jgi:hypothetical protein
MPTGKRRSRACIRVHSHAWRRTPQERAHSTTTSMRARDRIRTPGGVRHVQAGQARAQINSKREAGRGSRAAAGESSTAPKDAPRPPSRHRRNPPAASTIPRLARWARSRTLMPTLPRDRIRTPGGVRHREDRAARAKRQPGMQPTCIRTPGGVRHGRPAAKRSRVLLPSPFPRYSLGRGYEPLVIPATIRTLFNPVFTSEEPPRCSAPTPPPAPS